jgi:tryptophan-rich sensory protein
MTTLTARLRRPAPAWSRRSLALGALAAVSVAAAAAVGGLAARSGTGDYYAQLDKPSWSPPAAVFSPVWTALYVTMAVAAWLVARRGPARADVRVALILFGVQLALNAAWTPIFFAAREPGWAAVDIVALLAVLAATTVAFWRVSRTAGLLMVPYLGWVGFAAALNLAIALG